MAVATPSGGGPAGPAGLRWLAIPLAVGVLALIGLGASAESRDDFEDRVDTQPFGGEQAGGGELQPGDVTGQDWQLPDQEWSGLDPGDMPPSGVPGDLDPPGGVPGGVAPPNVQPGELTGGTPVDVEIRSPDGSVGLDLGENGTVTAPGAGPPGSGPSVLRPDPNGDIGGLRITEDGHLEPVPFDQLGPDDLVLRPVEGGVDLVRPDGSVVQLRPGPDGRGVEVSEVAPDGSVEQLSPDEQGQIDLGDGTTLVTAPPEQGPWEQSVPWRWIFGGIVAIVVASLALAGYLYLTRPEHEAGSVLLSPTGVPLDRFEEFLASLAADDDHPRAIRLAFLAAERGIGGLPPRRATETPFEWAERVAATRPEVAEPLTELCTLFATARFAPERPTAADRDRAVALLRQLNTPYQPDVRPDVVGGPPLSPSGARQG